VCSELHHLPKIHREAVSKKLVGWWDREVVYSLCGKRDRFIHFQELQKTISELIGDIVHEKLVPEFERANPPENYQPDGMLTKQIALVGGLKADLTKAIREEWRARAQRSKWINDNLGMATKIELYDDVLEENWKDVHDPIVEENKTATEPKKCSLGLEILRWSHELAPGTVRAFSEGRDRGY
jgi:hypothetical protein